jgi:DNA primase
MACHLAGITSAVATCGTAFGEDHIKILRRLLLDTAGSEAKVVFTFDGDAAGQKAALRAFEDDQKFAAQTLIAISPGGMDPCELRIAEGEDAVRNLIERASPLFEFAIRSTVARHNLDAAEGRAAALDACAPIVAQIKDASIRHEYAVQLAGMLGILDERFVVRRVQQVAQWAAERREGRGNARGPQRPGQPLRPGQAPPQPAPARPAFRLDARNPQQFVERELLKLAVQFPALVAPILDAFSPEEFITPPYAAVREAITSGGGVTAGAEAADIWVDVLREVAPDDAVRGLITELAVEPIRTRRAPDTLYAGEFLVKLRLQAVARRVAACRVQLQRLGPNAPAEQTEAVQRELWGLQQYEGELRSRGAAAL